MVVENEADVIAPAVVFLISVVMDQAESWVNGDGEYDVVADASVESVLITDMGNDLSMVDRANCWCFCFTPCCFWLCVLRLGCFLMLFKGIVLCALHISEGILFSLNVYLLHLSFLYLRRPLWM